MVISKPDISHITHLLSAITDPEIPVLSIIDLGVLRSVEWKDGKLVICITPTYSGCPAMDMISMSIRLRMLEAGIEKVDVIHQLSPAWTTDWMTSEGKQKLKQYGIAPPEKQNAGCGSELFSEATAQCPRCSSGNTSLVSEFGSTACKSLYKCNSCLEPFDYFKCH